MHFVDAKGILSAENGMNIYRGCTHGCIYCDSRSLCYGFTHPFEDIVVKQDAPALLEQRGVRCILALAQNISSFLYLPVRTNCTHSARLTE